MVIVDHSDPPKDFARAFGDALCQFLADKKIGQAAAARLLGIEAAEGGKRKGGARIHNYCHDTRDGRRTKPDAEILYLAVTRLPGFTFEHNGYRISAKTMNGNRAHKPAAEAPAEQQSFEFMRQFNLTGNQGTIAVTVRKPSGRIEVSLSLEAEAS